MTEPHTFPTKLKVGYRDYEIQDWPTKQATSANRYGEVAHTAGIIRIDTTHSAIEVAQTLLHEILHVVCTMWCRAEEDNEERTVSIVSTGLATVWRDNPDVMEWIAQNMRVVQPS